ncbi:MAG: AMIN domain-containing protein, partial [Alphaproteobacteria bacterium]|nr:AMIN domain-containing protein [Alphaproteobacteria bacterium]
FAQTAKMSQIRFGNQDEKTIRVVVHLNDKKPFRVFALQNPPRVVLDLKIPFGIKTARQKSQTA